MIRFLGKEQIPQLCRFCSGDPFGCRIASLALAYGADSGFAEFLAANHRKRTSLRGGFPSERRRDGTDFLCR